jgi:hypothetical protein
MLHKLDVPRRPRNTEEATTGAENGATNGTTNGITGTPPHTTNGVGSSESGGKKRSAGAAGLETPGSDIKRQRQIEALGTQEDNINKRGIVKEQPPSDVIVIDDDGPIAIDDD